MDMSEGTQHNGEGENTQVINTAGGDGLNNETTTVSSGKGNEEKKIFVGGLNYDVVNEELVRHFGQYGTVSNAQVKYDRMTGRSRGFAFVEFGDKESCQKALATPEHVVKGKKVEIKPAKSRENKKVFVGGLPADFNEEELKKHFEEYGKVEEIEWPFDKQRNAKRNFAFVVFEEEAGADAAAAVPKQTFGDRECDVKKATPQGRRPGMQGMMGFTGRGGRGGRGGWGQGYGNMGWGAGYGAGGWGDWYGGNYGYGAGYGAYGGGYDDYTGGNYSDYWGGNATAAGWNQYGGGAGAAGYEGYNAQSAGAASTNSQRGGRGGAQFAQY